MFTEISKLFATPQRVKLIKLFSVQGEHKYRADDLVKLISGGKARIAKELAALARLGILGERASKEGRVYWFDATHPLAASTRAYLEAATNLSDRDIIRAFRRVPGIECVVVAGVLVGEERSSVDVLIVGKKQTSVRIANAIKNLEETTIVPLRYTLLEHKEFVERREAYDRLIRDVLDFPYRVVVGRIPAH